MKRKTEWLWRIGRSGLLTLGAAAALIVFTGCPPAEDSEPGIPPVPRDEPIDTP